MSAPPPARERRARTWKRAWPVAAAVAIGMLLFLLLWLDQRGERGFYRGATPAAPAPGQVFEPLPAPTPQAARPAASARADGPDFTRGAPGSQPAPPRTMAPPPPPRPAAPLPAPEPVTAPVAVETAAPRYPRDALRQGVSGEVLLRVTVDVRGLPADIDVIQSSGSRDLDRAATAAARRWRFRPAMRQGVPVEGAVNVPILFDSQN